MAKPKSGIYELVLSLRCSWCKNLFPWKPRDFVRIERRWPRTCCQRCRARLVDWEKNRKLSSNNQLKR
jgi:hypothetical protein